MKSTIYDFKWSANPDLTISQNWHLKSRLDEIFEKWEGTPYQLGQKVPKAGVDCIRFVFGVLEELTGSPMIEPDKLPADTALHNPEVSFAMMRKVLETIGDYEYVTIEDGAEIHAGDIFITGSKTGAPAHVMIAGATQSQMWQCLEVIGVHKTGIAWPKGNNVGLLKLIRIIRVKDKKQWLSDSSSR